MDYHLSEEFVVHSSMNTSDDSWLRYCFCSLPAFLNISAPISWMRSVLFGPLLSEQRAFCGRYLGFFAKNSTWQASKVDEAIELCCRQIIFYHDKQVQIHQFCVARIEFPYRVSVVDSEP